MSGEDLLHRLCEEERIWLEDGDVHYRPCPHRGQPHYRADEPCVWMSQAATQAFLTWAVQQRYVTPSWGRACLRQGHLHEASQLADVATSGSHIQPDRLEVPVDGLWQSLFPVLLVGLALSLLFGYRGSQRT